MSARILECSPAEYLADPCASPSLSSSIAHTLVNRSALHAWNEHPKLGRKKRDATKEMDRGGLVHQLLLGTGPGIVIVDAKDWRTKIAKATREEARKTGKLAVLAKQFDELRTVTQILERKMVEEFGLVIDDATELVIEWTESSLILEKPVLCRAMLDHFSRGRRQIIDIKTCDSAHPRACLAHVINYGYLIQHAAYVSAVSALHPELAGRLDFVFVFVETEPPYVVTPIRLDGQLREIGDMNWRKAVERWGECLAAKEWPPYTREILTLEAPPYLLNRELGAPA